MKKIILISVLICLVIGCTPNTPNFSTQIVSTPTSVVNPISTSTSTASPEFVCKEPELLDLANIESDGRIIFTDKFYEGYIVDTNTFSKTSINTEDEIIFSIAVSPNKKLTAYELYSKKAETSTLVIIGYDGVSETIIPWEEDWKFIASWLDNQRLLISIFVEMKEEDNNAIEFSTFLVFNPFTNERKILEPNFPEIYSHHMFPTWDGFGSTVYDSNLELVVYPKHNLTSSDAFPHVTLWEIDKHEILADFNLFLDYKTTPRWSPNNEKFAIALVTMEELKNSEWPIFSLYTVTRFGMIEKITDLSNYFPYFYIGEHTWSPDGKYIAFWLSGWYKKPQDDYLRADQYLGVVDVESGDLKIYCISGQSPYPYQTVPPPIWSPDGTQIIVESHLSDEHSQVLLFDLEKEVIAKLGEDMTPLGWMIEP